VTYLLDINVLIALSDPRHVHYEPAHRWFSAVGSGSWATCPLTEAGFVRIISSPSYPSITATPADAAVRLRLSCAAHGHVFWPDTISILDPTLFDLSKLQGHRQIADAYLAALAKRNGGKLATFDANIPVAAIVGSTADLVEVIPAS
jgi:toxin-antitoxin system PIN domain toxin